jgi:hypothetical protein
MYQTKLRNSKFKIKSTGEIVDGSEWEIDTGRGSPFNVFSKRNDIDYLPDEHFLSLEIIELP